MNLLSKAWVYQKLGVANVARVVWYILKLKSGWLKYCLPIDSAISGEFYPLAGNTLSPAIEESLVEYTSDNSCLVFAWFKIPFELPPKWNVSVLNGSELSDNAKHWTEITDFASGIGDIKGVWELSRFNWVLDFSMKYAATGDAKWLEKSNSWISDWSINNPVNQGVNWKCAQEASIRVLHLASAALILRKLTPNPAMCSLIRQHLERIWPTLGYAKAQDNNHGTSEGAALFVGGSWLLLANESDEKAKKWMVAGRTYLHERAARLIEVDGSFSQYSVTYHRLMLDSLSFVELWRRSSELPEFSAAYLQSLKTATFWLLNMIDQTSGDAPNLGANDGAHILNFSCSDYREFRPSAELAAQLFLGKTAFNTRHCKLIQLIFSLTAKQQVMWPSSLKLTQGGYGVLRHKRGFCMLNVPCYRFRPSQADMLHLDFWLDGVNVLRDAGSFSYNTEEKWLNYFSGAQAHNTVQFDEQQPMPKLSRFLYGSWPVCDTFEVTTDELSASEVNSEQSIGVMQASYTNYRNQRHKREVIFNNQSLKIKDSIKGVQNIAVLRWRLPVDDWSIEDLQASCSNIIIQISSNCKSGVLTLEQGVESVFYGQKSNIPVLQYSVSSDADIITTISWK